MTWIVNGTPELDHISNYRTILGVCIALPILTTIIVGARAYTRAVVLKVLGLDDWIIFFSTVCGIIYAALCIEQSRWGLGLPITMRPKPNLDEYSVVNFAGRPFYQIGILGFKVALCWVYLRILKTSQNPKYKALVWTVMITCIIGHVAGTLVLIFQCSPVQKSWYPLTPGTCLPSDATFYGLAAVTIFYDVFIFFMPIPLLLNLNVDAKKKIVLCGVFLLGLLTTVCSIMRMYQITTIAKTGNSTMLVLWGVIELNIGIILTCIPTLGPLFPCFHSSTAGIPSTKNAYQLSSIHTHRNTVNGVTTTSNLQYDKYGAYRPDFVNAVNVSDSSSQEDTVRLKDPHSEILKTTDIRVSDGYPDRGSPGAYTRTW